MKTYLKALLTAVAMAVPVAAAAQDADVTLRIGNYGGAFTQATQKCVAEQFTARTGIKVVWVDGNPTDHVAKLIASRGMDAPLDLVYVDDPAQAQGIAAGVLDKIDPAAITNLQHLYPMARHPDNYGPAVNLFSVGLAYNAKIFEEKGIPAPKSWADLWNPQLAGHLALPDITTTAGMEMVIVAARFEGGNEKDIKSAFEKLAAANPLYFFKSSADLEAKFSSGDVWAAPWYNGRAWGMINRGFPLKYIFPAEGGFGMTTRVDVVKGTTHRDAALKYIDWALDPLPQLCQAHALPYGPTNATLEPVMAAYPALSQQFPATPDDLKQLYLPDWSVINAAYPRWLELWNRSIVK